MFYPVDTDSAFSWLAKWCTEQIGVVRTYFRNNDNKKISMMK